MRNELYMISCDTDVTYHNSSKTLSVLSAMLNAIYTAWAPEYQWWVSCFLASLEDLKLTSLYQVYGYYFKPPTWPPSTLYAKTVKKNPFNTLTRYQDPLIDFSKHQCGILSQSVMHRSVGDFVETGLCSPTSINNNSHRRYRNHHRQRKHCLSTDPLITPR